MIPKFGFDFADPYYEFGNVKFAFRICTLRNVYGIDPEQTSQEEREDGLKIEARGLRFAGGQRRCAGRLVAEIWRDDEGIRFKAEAEHDEIIKGITILIRGLAAPVEEEHIYKWPHPESDAPPFPEVETKDGGTACIMPATTELRFRRWAIYKEYSGNWVLNLSEDSPYPKRRKHVSGSEWVLVRNRPASENLARWYEMLERETGLRPWDERDDVPAWMREVSLVLHMHCESWTGYVFNTFERQMEILRWIGERIDGRHVLVYLPGWDGRYYWDYPIYKPSQACGGSEGLRRLVDGAHQLGMHVVPMFGLIGSNYEHTKSLGIEQAACHNAYDQEEICDWTEWDEDLATDPIWQPLNVGEETFRKYLLERIAWVTDTFGVDGAMLDITTWLPHDPRYDLLAGLKQLVSELHSRYEDFLIFGENWSELHIPFVPLFQDSMRVPDDHPFHRYCRRTAHLFHGAPGTGSNGVFESGYSPYQRPSPDDRTIPTLAVVQDTLPEHSDEVEAVIQGAGQWGERWTKADS